MAKPQLMNLKQAMEYLDIKSYTTLYRRINDGLEVTKLGNKRFISVDSVDKYIADHTKSYKKEQ
jgi:hypothetical protein